MKKILALVLALVLSLSVSLALAENTLTMATNASFPPYEYYDGEVIVGIDAEICAAIAAELGMDFEIVDMDFGNIIGAVQEGKVDVGMAGMTVTEERLNFINFSNTYATGIQSIIVKEGSPITCVDDLYAEGASYKVGVQLSTTGEIYATDDFGVDNVLAYNTGNDAVMALVNGKVDCVIIDNEPAKAFAAANAGLIVLDSSYAVEDYAACIAKENTELLEKFNAALAKLTENGTVAAIIEKYIPTTAAAEEAAQ